MNAYPESWGRRYYVSSGAWGRVRYISQSLWLKVDECKRKKSCTYIRNTHSKNSRAIDQLAFKDVLSDVKQAAAKAIKAEQ